MDKRDDHRTEDLINHSTTSVHTQPNTINTHAARPVYQKSASIMAISSHCLRHWSSASCSSSLIARRDHVVSLATGIGLPRFNDPRALLLGRNDSRFHALEER
jgi:hypothetical protein